jgi:trigger factor
MSNFATEEQKTSGKVAEGDSINIDYVGTVDGEAFDGGTAEDQTITVGSSGYIEGFDDGLVGVKVGDTVELNLTFPDTYSNDESLAGKDCVFTVTVNYKTVTVTPDLTDDFVAENFTVYGNSQTVDEFYAFVENKLRLSQITDAIWSDYVELCEVEYDEDEVQSLVDEMNSYYESQYESAYSVDLDTYLSAVGYERDDWDAEMTSQAQENIKEKMVVNKIAEVEDLVTDEAYEEQGLIYCASYGCDTVDELEETYGEEDVRYVITYSIVTEWLADQVEIIEGERPTEAETDTETVADTEDSTEAETESGTEEEAE